jgi:hypothetical protein
MSIGIFGTKDSVAVLIFARLPRAARVALLAKARSWGEATLGMVRDVRESR